MAGVIQLGFVVVGILASSTAIVAARKTTFGERLPRMVGTAGLLIGAKGESHHELGGVRCS